jgi:alpha-D-xyloside xylohydrolase
MRFAIYLLLLLLVSPLAASPIVSVEKNADGVTFKLDGAVMKLQVFTDRVIRVVYAPRDAIPQAQSLSVIATPRAVHWDLQDHGDSLILTTPAVQARVDRKTGAVTFFDAAGNLYVAEGGRDLGPTALKNLDALQSRQEFALQPDESIFGLGQHQQGIWNYRGRTVQLLQRNMEIALPIAISSRGYGVLWDNPAITKVEVGIPGKENVLAWNSEAARDIDYYFMAGPDLDDVVAAYRQLTGAAPLFGEWAYGFWQCKEHYATQKELLDVVARYRQRGTPIDGIIQDWFYWDPHPWGSHEFDSSRYSDPASLMEQLHKENVHLIISVWARFDDNSDHYQQLDAIHGLLDRATPIRRGPNASATHNFGGTLFKFYDAFNPQARQLYWRQMSDSLFKFGIDGWWLDATEPEIRDASAMRTLTTGAGPGALVANAYPLMTTSAVYRGQRAETSDKRVFILTRSAYAGQQRNAAVSWSGDIQGNWAMFARQIPAGLNFCVSGIPYWNTDIGGFFSRASPAYAELFTRWFQFGAFCPMFRVHGTNQPKEMWRFDAKTDATLVKFDQLRYRLMPYIYSTAWGITSRGDTLMRPLVMDFRTDAQAVKIGDQFMFGHAILVNPVTKAGASSRAVYLPAGQDWYDFWTGARLSGGQAIDAPAPIDSMPLYVKASSIVPMGPVVNYAREKPDAPLELRVYRGKDAQFTLYDDAGDGYNYENGQYTEIPITWNDQAGKLTIGDRKGSYPGMAASRQFKVVWVRDGKGAGLTEEPSPDATVTYSGTAMDVAAQ